MKKSSKPAHLRMPTAEWRLALQAAELPGQKILSTSLGYAPLAHRLANERFDARVSCWILDAYQAAQARRYPQSSPRTEIACSAECPQGTFDLGLVPLSANGSSELARDLMQSVYNRIEVGGHFVVSVDNRRDRWVRAHLRDFDKSIRAIEYDDASVYVIVKRTELKKLKRFECELAFRDSGNLIRLITRPGVFSHRSFDNGARQLLDAVQLNPGDRVLDLGCGSGAVALALARRDHSARLVALDSNARAVDCTLRGATANALNNVETVLALADDWQPSEQFNWVLANPPYYGDFRIAKVFLEAAQRCLKPGGTVIVVSKHPNWYRENMPLWFGDCQVDTSRRYYIARGTQVQSPSILHSTKQPADPSEAPHFG